MYPEHEKLASLKGENQIIGSFIEWMNEKYYLCELIGEEFRPVSSNVQELLAKYFEIDLNKLEAEKTAMLKSLQTSYQTKPEPERECLHMQCPNCHGKGLDRDGRMCVHGISCPCPRCSPYSCVGQ